MKILAVCGMGLGSGLLLRMTCESALRRLGVKDFDVEVADIGTARGAGIGADVIVTSGELARTLGAVRGKVVTIDNFFDVDEMAMKLRTVIPTASS